MPRGRRTTFTGLAVIVAVWTLDALLQAVTGSSPLFSAIDGIKHAISGHGMCTPEEVASADRLSGVLGPCNLKLGPVLASLSPFVLFAGGRRLGTAGWLLAAAAVGIVLVLAGSRASWITFAIALALSGWRLLGWKKLLGVFVVGAIAIGALTTGVPQVRERIARTAHALTADVEGVDSALSGRARIWNAARLHGARASHQRHRRSRFPRGVPRLRSATGPGGRLGHGPGAARAPDRAGSAERDRRVRPADVDGRRRAGLARMAFRRRPGARARASGDAGRWR